MHGMLMGLTRREAAARIEAVAEMSGLGEAMDRRVSTYSTGMRARLCFSTAINLEPDILLVDEAIVVGDHEFRAKSERIMRERFTEDRAIVLVSHSLAQRRASLRTCCLAGSWRNPGAGRHPKTLSRAYREAGNGRH